MSLGHSYVSPHVRGGPFGAIGVVHSLRALKPNIDTVDPVHIRVSYVIEHAGVIIVQEGVDAAGNHMVKVGGRRETIGGPGDRKPPNTDTAAASDPEPKMSPFPGVVEHNHASSNSIVVLTRVISASHPATSHPKGVGMFEFKIPDP